MDIFEAIIQGIVQGLTEFLPISSSGHLLISQHILGVNENNLFFDVMLHIGTLLAVITFYRQKILKLIMAFFGLIKDVTKHGIKISKLNKDKNFVLMVIVGLIPLLLMFLPAAPGSMDLKDFAELLCEGDYMIIPGISLIITGILLYIGLNIDKFSKKSRAVTERNKGRIGVYDALWIGLAQFFAALFPGISRSGSTLSVGLIRGLNKQVAFDYSFILGIPAIMAAALLEIKESFDSGIVYQIDFIPVIIGMLVSAIVGFFAIKLFKWLLSTEKMWIFIVYLFIVGSLSTLIGIIEIFTGTNIFTGIKI